MNWFNPGLNPGERPRNLRHDYLGAAVIARLLPIVGLGLANTALLAKFENQIKANQVKRRALNQLIRQSDLDVATGHFPKELEDAHGMYLKPYEGERLFGERKGTGTHGTVVLPKSKTFSPVVMAHELGHAQDYAGKTGVLGKLMLKLRSPALALGFGGSLGTSIYAMAGKKSPEQRERLLNIASIMSGLGSVPIMASEYTASRNAMKLLQQMPEGVRNRLLAGGQTLLPTALGTYGLPALSGVLAPQAMKYGLRWAQNNLRQ